LINNLEELEISVREGKRYFDLCDAEFVTHLSILPLSAFAYHNKISITFSEGNSDILNYLETIGFPYGFTDLAKTRKDYLPIARLPPVEDNTVLG